MRLWCVDLFVRLIWFWCFCWVCIDDMIIKDFFLRWCFCVNWGWNVVLFYYMYMFDWVNLGNVKIVGFEVDLGMVGN